MTDEKNYSPGEHVDDEPIDNRRISSRNRTLLIIVGTAITLIVIVLFLWPRHESANKRQGNAVAENKEAEDDVSAGSEVVLSPTAFAAPGIEIVGVTERPAVALLRVTGAVEANLQQTQ